MAEKLTYCGDPLLGIRLGFSYQDGSDQIKLYNVPSDIRTTPPHPDDILNRPGDILDTTISDNYLVRENIVKIDIDRRQTLELGVTILGGIISVAIRTTAIEKSKTIFWQNQFRKAYIDPIPGDPYEGSAFIYYLMYSKNRDFFDKNSFSIPVYISYPFIEIGENRKVLLRVLVGTNALLPETIEIVSEQGWDRYGALEIHNQKKLGVLKAKNWYYGLGIEGSIIKNLRTGLEFSFVQTQYRGKFDIPVSFESDSNIHPVFKIYCSSLFE
jgi:hypothetical protein